MAGDFADATVDALLYFFEKGLAPSRKAMVNRIRQQQHGLHDDRRLDLKVANLLNSLVKAGTLRRIKGKLYVPGDQYCKSLCDCTKSDGIGP